MKEFKYDVVNLIQAIRDRPCLWDKTIENYKDRVERRTCWEEIFNMLEARYEEMTAEEKRLTGETILNKWTNIRDTFMKSLKSKLGRPKRRYVFYEHLKFLTKIRPEECTIEQTESMDESNDVTSYEIPLKQEIDSVSPESLDIISYPIERMSKHNDSDDINLSLSTIDTAYSQKKKSKRKAFDDLKATAYSTKESGRGKKKKKISADINDTINSNTSKKQSKSETSKTSDNYIDNDIDFVEVDEADNPRVMNEDEAFFASLLPTVVRYSEDERLEFRIEVLKVMKKIKDERKCFED